MVHKPKHKVHSFRGLLGDGGQDEINLERQNVNIAYRIVKLQVINDTPGVANQESIVKVYRESQSSIGIDAVINFTDPDLLGCAFLSIGSSVTYPSDIEIIFDNVLFSRNIFITHSEIAGNLACNYYIEIEEVPVSASALIQIKLGTARRIKTKESMG